MRNEPNLGAARSWLRLAAAGEVAWDRLLEGEKLTSKVYFIEAGIGDGKQAMRDLVAAMRE